MPRARRRSSSSSSPPLLPVSSLLLPFSAAFSSLTTLWWSVHVSAMVRPPVAARLGRRAAGSPAFASPRSRPLLPRGGRDPLLSTLSSSSACLPPSAPSECRRSLPPFSRFPRRFQSSSTGSSALGMSIEDTPLGSTKAGAALLDGLDVHVVPAEEDGHPLAVYGIDSDSPFRADASCLPVLLLHGRTWSSVPVYHLLGGPENASQNIPGRESRSLMESLHQSGLSPYAMDFRGFGGTPRDGAGYVEPNRCVRDVESVLRWIADRHGSEARDEDGNEDAGELPALLGWSQGALVAQLAAQRSSSPNPRLLSKLVLYGSIYDPMVNYPREPLYLSNSSSTNQNEEIENEFDAAIEDFTVEGSIPPEPARLFAEAALVTDPIKARWRHLHQFNNCDPARVHIPTLVVAGDQDPYAPLRVQSDLFTNLGRGADRSWSVISDADHAVHLLDGRARFVRIVRDFLEN